MYKKISEEEKKALNKYPKYNKSKPTTYVGSREYYENIFATETNRDANLHEAFSDLHKKIINLIVQFCEEHNLKDVDEVFINANGLTGSYGSHKWCSPTDSSMDMIKLIPSNIPGWPFEVPDRDNPFLHEA